MKLVMLETNGNQRFVFSSSRLRENVGASYLITQLADWTEQAANCLGIDKFGWISKSSGKVILTAATEDYARKLIGQVTRKAFSAAPGLDVSGVFVDMCDPGNEVKRPRISNRDLKEVHRKAAEYALNRPPAQARFSQMPFLQRGRDSALPASSRLDVCDEAKDDRETALSLSSRVCRYRANDARHHFMKLAEDYFLKVIEGHWSANKIKELLVRDPTKLEEKLEEKRKKTLINELLEEFKGNIDSTFSKDTKKQETDKRKSRARNDQVRAEGEHEGQTEDELIDRKDRTEDERLSKVAVIHIDGNGVGGIMRDLVGTLKRIPRPVFEEEVPDAQDYSTATEEDVPSHALRCFLLEINGRLEEAMQKSFLTAWAEVAFLAEKEVKDIAAIPVVPVILGGDDATVITDATYALPFTEKFLTAFEEETGKDALLKYLGPKSRQGIGGCAKGIGEDENAESAGGTAKSMGKDRSADGAGESADNNGENAERESKNAESANEKQGGPMTAAAGVAIIPRKFPFHIAYDLAERLIKSAKALGKEPEKECSTLSFHVLFDSTVLDPDELLRSYKSFTRRPFKIFSDVVREAVAKNENSKASERAAEGPDENPKWNEMCKRTRLFIGLPQNQGSGKDSNGLPRTDPKSSPNEKLRFPMTRATRIRKIQSDAAKRGMGDRISRLTKEIFKVSIDQSESGGHESGEKQTDSAKLDWNDPRSVAKKIVDEWNAALESLDSARKSIEVHKPDTMHPAGYSTRGSAETSTSSSDTTSWKQLTPNDLFDLIELADLLPQSYLEELARKETGQGGTADQQNDEGQEATSGQTSKADKGNSDSTSGNGPAAASQEARK